jgi:hypothetical protein
MKTASKVLGVMLALLLAASPALAAIEAGMEAKSGLTLADFQKTYDGTKSIVAWNKFQEYQLLEKTPRPTLAVSQMRMSPSELKTLADFEAHYSGTKSIVALNKFYIKDRGITTSVGQKAPSHIGLKYRETKTSF